MGSSPHTRGTPPKGVLGHILGEDHPRIRGEHPWPSHGSPSCRGIIPAYAGNTLYFMVGFLPSRGSSPHTRGTLAYSSPPSLCNKDHPRIRGEHQEDDGQPALREGIIPAYAGNTLWPMMYCSAFGGSSPHTRGTRMQTDPYGIRRGDHPRIRGEHCPLHREPHGGVGIIPAYAGNTSTNILGFQVRMGSSPHTRGTLAHRRIAAR